MFLLLFGIFHYTFSNPGTNGFLFNKLFLEKLPYKVRKNHAQVIGAIRIANFFNGIPGFSSQNVLKIFFGSGIYCLFIKKTG